MHMYVMCVHVIFAAYDTVDVVGGVTEVTSVMSGKIVVVSCVVSVSCIGVQCVNLTRLTRN